MMYTRMSIPSYTMYIHKCPFGIVYLEMSIQNDLVSSPHSSRNGPVGSGSGLQTLAPDSGVQSDSHSELLTPKPPEIVLKHTTDSYKTLQAC